VGQKPPTVPSLGAPHFQPPPLELQKLLHKLGHKDRQQFSNFKGITGYILLVLLNLNDPARGRRGQVETSSRPVGTDRTERAAPVCKIQIAANTECYRGSDRR